MRVSKVLGQDRVLEALDDPQVIEEPGLCALLVVGWNVTDDVHLLTVQLCLQ